MNTGNYENYLIREANGELWPLDRTEATADWFDHDVNPDGDVRVPAPSGIHLPESFEEWINQNNDSIIQ